MNVTDVAPCIDESPPLLHDEEGGRGIKPVVLVFARYYLPGYRAGGPIRTIANIVERLSDTFEFRIIASDRDLGAQDPYLDAEHGRWLLRGKALVRYVPAESFGVGDVAELVRSTPHDVIYLNSFFDPRFTQQVLVNRRVGRLAGRPVVIAPRGEFSAGALRLKRYKKLALLRLGKLMGLYDDLTWQASSSHEADDIQRGLAVGQHGGISGSVVVTGHVASVTATDSAGWSTARRQAGDVLRVCFLSRVSPMKNLDFALRVLARVDIPVRFSIYGPVEDSSYWAQCGELIAKLPAHIEVIYEGMVEHTLVVQKLTQHDLFLLPTRGENFGHVIHEALRAGLPLLISDQTPWKNLAEEGVGWELALDDASAFARKIELVAGWTQAEREATALRSRQFAARKGGDIEVIEANRKLFLNVIAQHKGSS